MAGWRVLEASAVSWLELGWFLVRELGGWRLGRQFLISRGAELWFGIDWQLDFPFRGSLG